jgi:non-specific serine/threonine protein kinase
MIGKSISHYKILEKLGGGAMGIVYRAEDTRLRRMVALKFLPLELSEDETARKRFVREARSASALDHPNICTIHEIDETRRGQMYICMPFYAGETLKKRIDRGQLPVEQASGIAIGVAKGLAKAHEHGMIHRDVKPANIMITNDDVVKIVDFGLAKLAGAKDITGTGKIVGTVAYMSPEQITGRKVDHRTDIWSLGVVLFEMLCGQLPFQGENEQALSYSILNESPKSITSIRQDIPDDLERIVCRALEKDPVDRYHNAEAMLQDLRITSAIGAALPDQIASVVVLPFENISPDKDNEYFSDGLTQEIITGLSRMHDLRVISRSSAMKLKGTTKSIPTIGRELGVQFVLEGSVRKVGNDLRITAQLVDAANDTYLWADKYDGTLGDVFDIQESVSRAIIDSLKLKLTPEEEESLAERPIDDVHAYECYLRARKEFMLFTEDGFDRALEYLQEALDIVGENTVIFAGLGYAHFSYVNIGSGDRDAHLAKVEEYAAKIRELEPESPRLHLLRGLTNMVKGGSHQETVRHLKRALIADPNDPDALFWLVIICSDVGRTAWAMRFAERLIQVDPLTPVNHAAPGYVRLSEGRFDLSLEYQRRWYEMEGKKGVSRFWYAWVLAHNGQFDDARALFQEAATDSPENVWTKLGLCFLHALDGENDQLLGLADELAPLAETDSEYSLNLAECFSIAGEKERALGWLENSVDRGFINYVLISREDRFLESIRSEPRFVVLLERVKKEWERFEV